MKGFGYISARRQCWSFDLDRLNKYLLPQPQETHEIWLQLPQCLFRIEMFEIVRAMRVQGQRSKSDLDIFYSLNVIKCHVFAKLTVYTPNFRLKSSKLPMKCFELAFPILDLVVQKIQVILTILVVFGYLMLHI